MQGVVQIHTHNKFPRRLRADITNCWVLGFFSGLGSFGVSALTLGVLGFRAKGFSGFGFGGFAFMLSA